MFTPFDGKTVKTNQQPKNIKISTPIHSYMKMYVLYYKVKKVHQHLQLRQKCSFNTSNNKLQQERVNSSLNGCHVNRLREAGRGEGV